MGTDVQDGLDDRGIAGRPLAWVVYVAFLIIAISTGIFLYWSTADYKLFTFNKVTAVNKVVAPGEAIIFHYDYCKELDQDIKTTSTLIGTHDTYLRPPMENTQRKGCYNIPIPIVILPDRKPDTYHFHYKLCAKVNPIREICEEHISPMFKVATEAAK